MHKHWFYERDDEVIGLSDYIGADHAALLAWGWLVTGLTSALLELGIAGWIGLQVSAHVLLAVYCARRQKGMQE